MHMLMFHMLRFSAGCGCRLDVLREAAGQYQELNYITMKYKKWMLQQVRYLLVFEPGCCHRLSRTLFAR